MTNIEFSEKIVEYLQKKKRNFIMLFPWPIIFFTLGYISDDSFSRVHYVFAAVFLGYLIRNNPYTKDAMLLTTVVKFLSDSKNT